MKGLTIFLVMIAVPAAIVLYWAIRPKLVRKRRQRLRELPNPEGLEEVLARNIGLYSRLPPELQAELRGHINVFLNEKRFRGISGQEVTPEVMFTVAGAACILLLNREPAYFPGFSSILIYPTAYEAPQVDREGGVETHRSSRRAGESWHRGPVVLSWGDVLYGASNADDGYNVVLHEFAHKLDEANNGTNGMPILRELGHYEDWTEVLSREYQLLEGRVARRKNRVLDAYGLTSPAEFFAVATESFFEKPAAMRKHLPDLYEQLQRYYAVDPASWPRSADQ